MVSILDVTFAIGIILLAKEGRRREWETHLSKALEFL